MKEIPKWAKYVARDSDGTLYAYEIKPIKESHVWSYKGRYVWLPRGLFPDVKWSDDKSTEISQVFMFKEEGGRMSGIIDPVEIRSITSNTPITITFNDGSTITACEFYFKDLTRYTSSESDDYTGVLEVAE